MHTSSQNIESEGVDNFGRLFEIERIAIGLLRPHPNHARTHSRSQIGKLRKSVRTFGEMKPLLATRDLFVIAGHAMLEALKLEGYKHVQIIRINDLTPELIRAYLLADNRLAEDAAWHQELLRVEIEHFIHVPDFDLEITGFGPPEIDLILDGSDNENDPIDKIPAITDTAVSTFGDLWILREHRILHADARESNSVEVVCDGRLASVAFLDPPYNVPIEGHASGNGKIRHAEFAMGVGEMSQEEFTGFLTTCLANAARSSVAGAVHYVCMDFRHMGELLSAGRKVYTALLNLCVWCKDKGGMGSFYRGAHELIFVFKVGDGTPRNNVQLGRFGRNRTNVWHYPSASALSRSPGEENVLALHPTVKPVALVADALLDCSARREIVLDCFLGSGSTLLAAQRVGRICYGIEYEGRYVDLAIRRWQQLTGETARHAVTGETFSSMEAANG